MRTSIAFAIAGAGLATAVVSTGMATEPRPTTSTIEQCAALLPQGKTYTFQVTGTVDTTGSTPKLSGEMSVSDGTHDDSSAASAAFGECIGRLIK